MIANHFITVVTHTYIRKELSHRNNLKACLSFEIKRFRHAKLSPELSWV